MHFTQHYSGSKGNLYTVEFEDGKRVLIDPGVPWKKIIKALDYKLDNIAACLLSHEHMDHAWAAEDVLNNGIPVYASEGTLKALGIADQRNVHCVKPCEQIWFERFDVAAFPTEHDAAEPIGFVIREATGVNRDRKPKQPHCNYDYMLFATDTAFMRLKFGHAFKIIAIECSYDTDILESRISKKEVDESLGRRLLDSHMAKNTLLEYIKTLNVSECSEFHLLHCSGGNLDAKKLCEEIEREHFLKAIVK
jgi:phosphoribosyl 1,2-cyclic phosphodiesterase